MKKLGIILSLILIFGIQSTYSQEAETKTKEQKKIEKQKAKEEAKKLEEAQWYQLKQVIDDKQFVFMGNIINSTNGTTTLDPRINFVSIQGDQAVVQFASGFGGNQNGIGGYTVEGLLDNYVVKAKKVGKEININLIVVPKAGQGVRSQPLNLNIIAFSFDSARLQIGGTTAFMQGEIKTPADAKIFKGNTPN